MKTTKVKTEWASDMAGVLQRTAEGLLNTKEGGLTNLITEKSMAVAAGITLMGIAKAIGTAGTGTAISTLSGAAARTAMVAWFGGGSTFIGGFIVLPLLIAGVGWLGWRLLKGAERKPGELNKNELAIFNSCWAFSALLHNKSKGDKPSLQLPQEDIDALRILQDRIRKYWRYGCRQSSHVRERTRKNLEEMSKLLDTLG